MTEEVMIEKTNTLTMPYAESPARSQNSVTPTTFRSSHHVSALESMDTFGFVSFRTFLHSSKST